MRHGSPDVHADPRVFLEGAATRATILLVESFRRFASGLQRLSVEEAGWNPEVFWNFHPGTLGEILSNLTSKHFFQMGWELNHQLVNLVFCITLDLQPQTPGCGCLVTTRMTFFTVFRETGNPYLPLVTSQHPGACGSWPITSTHPTSELQGVAYTQYWPSHFKPRNKKHGWSDTLVGHFVDLGPFLAHEIRSLTLRPPWKRMVGRWLF